MVIIIIMWAGVLRAWLWGTEGNVADRIALRASADDLARGIAGHWPPRLHSLTLVGRGGEGHHVVGVVEVLKAGGGHHVARVVEMLGAGGHHVVGGRCRGWVS